MKNSILNKIFLLLTIVFMGQKIETKLSDMKFSNEVEQALRQIDEIVLAGEFKYDALSLAVVLDKVDVNFDLYRAIIKHFIKKGCNIYETFDESFYYEFLPIIEEDEYIHFLEKEGIIDSLEKDESYGINQKKEQFDVLENDEQICDCSEVAQREGITIFHTAIMANATLLKSLVEYIPDLSILEQLDILIYPTEQIYMPCSDFSIVLKNTTIFFKNCNRLAQEKFLELYPNMQEIDTQ